MPPGSSSQEGASKMKIEKEKEKNLGLEARSTSPDQKTLAAYGACLLYKDCG